MIANVLLMPPPSCPSLPRTTRRRLPRSLPPPACRGHPAGLPPADAGYRPHQRHPHRRHSSKPVAPHAWHPPACDPLGGTARRQGFLSECLKALPQPAQLCKAKSTRPVRAIHFSQALVNSEANEPMSSVFLSPAQMPPAHVCAPASFCASPVPAIPLVLAQCLQRTPLHH